MKVCVAILSSFFSSGLCQVTEVTNANAITSKAELNAAIEAGSNKNVGFLSMGNYNSIAPILSDQAIPRIYDDTNALYAAVDSGEVLAGLISGQPDARFTAFSSELISPRGFQMSTGPDAVDLMQAVDAAVVRSHNAGDILRIMNQNPPFEAVEVHNCRVDDPTVVPFPDSNTATGLLADVLSTRVLKILALGEADNKPNWNDDGNYQVEPPVGFWPDYMNSFMSYFRAAYGSDIALERVWQTPSSDTRLVMNGTVHMTEPYYVAENMYEWSGSGTGQMKKWVHQFSCIVMGYEKTFFVKTPSVTVNDASDPECASALQACVNRRMAQQIASRAQLNAAIDAAGADQPRKTIGFLSMGNYNSIAPGLSDNAIPMIFGDTDEIYAALEAGTVVAGMISGQPDSRFRAFPTERISPRAFQFSPGPEAVDLIRAVDAAIVRGHNAGDIRTAMLASPPFEAVDVHNCRVDNPSVVPFPPASSATGLLADVLSTRRLKMLALGEPGDLPNWHADGNYQVTPMTGFWPHYMDLFMTHFRAQYGNDIVLERVWSRPSSNTTLIMNGDVHMTEPYYIGENLYTGTGAGNGQLKKWTHAFSCFVMGYEQQFFTLRATTDFSNAGSSCELQLAACDYGEVSDGAVHFGITSSLSWLVALLLLMRV